jgi:hypothetical protein
MPRALTIARKTFAKGRELFGPVALSGGTRFAVTLSRTGWSGLNSISEILKITVEISQNGGVTWQHLVGFGVMDDAIIDPLTSSPVAISSVSNIVVPWDCLARVVVDAAESVDTDIAVDVL